MAIMQKSELILACSQLLYQYNRNAVEKAIKPLIFWAQLFETENVVS